MAGRMLVNNNKKRPRIAIGFFGITRSLKWTLPSIQKNIIEPARKLGEVRLFAHLYQQNRIENPRSGENNSVDPDEYQLLNCDEVQLEAPGACLSAANYEWILSHGDAFKDGGKSLSNLIHQLHSLQEVGRMMDSWKPDLFVLARPDLMYYDDFSEVITKQLNSPSNSISIPNWQWYGGYNDRFSVCGPDAGHAYTNRIDLIPEYLKKTGGPLPAERFLRFNLHKKKIVLNFCTITASRIRVNGVIVKENFSEPSFSKLLKRFIQRYLE
jgi:hypothetical protein